MSNSVKHPYPVPGRDAVCPKCKGILHPEHDELCVRKFNYELQQEFGGHRLWWYHKSCMEWMKRKEIAKNFHYSWGLGESWDEYQKRKNEVINDIAKESVEEFYKCFKPGELITGLQEYKASHKTPRKKRVRRQEDYPNSFLRGLQI